MVNRRASLGLVAVLALGGAVMGACEDETSTSTSNPSSTTGTQSGGGGAGAEGGSVGGNGAGAGGSGGGVTNTTNVNCEAPSGAAGALSTEPVASGFTEPVDFAFAWGDSTRLYVVEKSGVVNLVKEGDTTVFLDIQDRVVSGPGGDERGLLGIAFHPNYVNNGRFFVHYSNGTNGPGASSGDTVIEEYRRDPGNADVADDTPVGLIYTTNQPFGNHNGGTIAFSPVDGFLWIGLGDGGSGNDPQGHGQDKNTPLATLLRLDVDSATPYAAPPGNITDGLNLIHDWGLRNPYRWSFDMCTGDRYIGDVGQDCFEEINVAPASAGPTNWGWSTVEGDLCFSANLDPACDMPPACDKTGMEGPIVTNPHVGGGNSITGGAVYRGTAIPWLRGTYFYGDIARNRIWTLRWEAGSVTEGPTDVTAELGVNAPASFGVDNEGELYIVGYGGALHRVIAE